MAKNNRRGGGRRPAAIPDEVPTPNAEVVVRFKRRLAHDLRPRGEDEPIDSPTVQVFRQAYLGFNGPLVVVNEAYGSNHFFMIEDVESVETVESALDVYGPDSAPDGVIPESH